MCCDDRRCYDCIRKHLLFAEALAEEGAAMDKSGTFTAYLNRLARSLRKIEQQFFGTMDYSSVEAADGKDNMADEDAPSTGRVTCDTNNIKQALRDHRKYINHVYGPQWDAMYSRQ